MKLSGLMDLGYGLTERNIQADVVVLIDGKEVGITSSKEVTERGKTRVVLVPAKPRASRSKAGSGIEALAQIRRDNFPPGSLRQFNDIEGGIKDGVITDTAGL